MINPRVTIGLPNLSAAANRRLPGWTLPFVVRLGEALVAEVANADVPATLVVRDGETLVHDMSPQAHEREFGTSVTPARPALQDAVARLRIGGGA